MGTEIERKFIVEDFDSILKDQSSIIAATLLIKQIYLYEDDNVVVRLRDVIVEDGPFTEEGCFLTFKSKNKSCSSLIRDEHELCIAYSGMEEILNHYFNQSNSIIIKRRYHVFRKPETPNKLVRKWEVDHFLNVEKPFYLAEAELDDENEILDIPFWCRKEVTLDPEFQNSHIAQNLPKKPLDTEPDL